MATANTRYCQSWVKLFESSEAQDYPGQEHNWPYKVADAGADTANCAEVNVDGHLSSSVRRLAL